MELRCHWCLVSSAIISLAITHHCGHNICVFCHHKYRSHQCVVCQNEVPIAATDCGIPETPTWNRHPNTPSHPAPQPQMSPFAISSLHALSTTHTNTTLPSTPQTHTSPETRFGLSAPKEDSHQNSVRGMNNSGDINQMLYNTQRGEQNSETGKPGIVSQLKKKFDSGVFTSPEGAAGWKNSEEHPRVAQSSFHASRQQETFGRSKDSLTPDTPPGSHLLALLNEGQTTPQRRKVHSRGQQPYPQDIATRDAYLTPSRAREPSPSLSRNRYTSPSPSRSRISSPSPSRPTDLSCCPSKTKEPSSSPSKPRYHSPSPSRTRKSSPPPSKPTEPFALHFVGKDAKFSGTCRQGGSVGGATPRPTATQEPPLLKQPLTPIRTEGLTIPRTPRPIPTTITPGRPDKEVMVNGLPHHHLGKSPHTLSQPSSPTQNQGLRGEEEEEEAFKERIAAEFFRLYGLSKELWTEFLTLNEIRERCERLEEERKRHLEEQEQLRKEEKRLQSELKQQTEKVDELQHEVTQLREKQRGQEEDMQQPMGKEHLKSLNENLLRQLETLKQENTKLEGKLNCKEEEMEMKEEEWAWMKKECDEQQQEIVTLKEKDHKHQEELARLGELSARQQDRALLEELTSLQEQIRTLTLENTELKGEVTSLRGAKDAQEIEAIYWKEESAKQQKAAQEELGRFKMQEVRHMQNYHKWEGKIKEMLTKLTFQEKEMKQLSERNSNLQNELQQVTEDRAKCREDATQLERENEHHQKEKGEYEEEVRHLKQELSGRHAEREELINLYKEEIEKLDMKEAALEQDISHLIAKDIQNQEELAALRTSKEEVRHLIRERDSCQEEIDRLKKKEASYKEKMAQLRRERDDYQLQIQLQKSTPVTIEVLQRIDNLLLERDEFRRKEASQQQAATQLRQERDYYKEELDQLKGRESAKLTQMRKERDSYKEELDQLKGRESTKLTQMRRERDKYQEEVNQLKGREDSYIEKVNELNRRENNKISELQQERDSLKQEVGHLKRRENTQITQMRRERDNHREEVDELRRRDHRQSEAENLRREMEVVLGTGEAGQRGVTQPERDLANIPAPPAHIQQHTTRAAEGKEVATLGLEEELVTQGLPNLGNSCYINSVVQCLYHLPALRNALASPRIFQHNQSGMRVALALAQLFGAMQSAPDMMIQFAARDLKGVLGSHDASFRDRQQQEAHDLFSALVSWLQTDLSQYDVPDSPCHASSLFNGMLETKITCQDSSTLLTHTSEAFTSLSLPVMGRNSLSLEDLLSKYFREQTLEWDCQHCLCAHECCHRTHIRSCPPVLVIHFSRVAEYRSTRKTKVDFPLTGLSLHRYMAPNAPPLPQYQLVGVVCHEGNMGSGHYIAYCRYGSAYGHNKWRVCNDELVSDVRVRDMLDDGNAHLLFYIQQ